MIGNGPKYFVDSGPQTASATALHTISLRKERGAFPASVGEKMAAYLAREAVPFAGMIILECTDVGASIVTKAALEQGMSNFVSVVYFNALATLLLLPYIIFCRKKQAPLTPSLLWRFFLLGLIGSTGQVMFQIGVHLSSPTLSAAMSNLIPIFTFFLAVITRMETLDLRRSTGQAKAMGSIVSVSGAFIATLYTGPAILTLSTSNSHHQLLHSEQTKWIIGGILLAMVSILASTWNVAQGATVKEYPEEMTIVFFFTFFVTILSAIFSLIFERDPSAWTLKSSIEVTAIVYMAIFGSLFRIGVQTWCLRKKGPLYVAIFRPLSIVIAMFMSLAFLGDALHLGSVIGSVTIAVGFYGVMWGQINEKKMAALDNETCAAESSNGTTPLLRSNAREDA